MDLNSHFWISTRALSFQLVTSNSQFVTCNSCFTISRRYLLEVNKILDTRLTYLTISYLNVYIMERLDTRVFPFPNLRFLKKDLTYKDFHARYQVPFYVWQIGFVLKLFKIPKFYEKDCRWTLRKKTEAYKQKL